MLIDIVLHLMKHDDIGHIVINKMGDLEYPEPPQGMAGQAVPQTRKILIYQEWPMMAHTISSVCTVFAFVALKF